MNAKYAIALILTLQVSLSLCDDPTVSPELLEKYNTYKETFNQRFQNLKTNLRNLLTEEEKKEVDSFLHTLSTCELPICNGFKLSSALLQSVGQELAPHRDTARIRVLAFYEDKLRPYVGGVLSEVIEIIKIFLDEFLPAN